MGKRYQSLRLTCHEWSDMRVAVFCSSSANIDKRHVDMAFDLGTALALNGADLVWGGGQVSMMGAVAKAIRLSGRKSIGVIPEHLTNLELADPEADEMFVVDTMRNRKQKMDDLSDAFIILPGGIGTLEEFFEIWTAKYLGFHKKPVVVCDPDGVFEQLRVALDYLVDLNFMNLKQEAHISWCRDIPSALKAIGL
jgi:uncharacterized protein (TIGR00730 family)